MSESIIPTIRGILGDYVIRQHIMRYVFASKYIRGKIVADVACGTGYGSHYLAVQGARYVIAVDLDIYTLITAKGYYSAFNLDYVCGDARSLPLRNGSIDVFVSFETIEHLDNPTLFLSEIVRTLKSSGVLIISTPNRRWTSHPPFHLYEFYPKEFYKLLEKYFTYVEKFAQYISYRQLLKDLYSRFRSRVTKPLRLALRKILCLVERGTVLKTMIFALLKLAPFSFLYDVLIRKKTSRKSSYSDSKPIRINNTIIRLLERYEDCRIVPFKSRRKPLRIMIAVCRRARVRT